MIKKIIKKALPQKKATKVDLRVQEVRREYQLTMEALAQYNKYPTRWHLLSLFEHLALLRRSNKVTIQVVALFDSDAHVDDFQLTFFGKGVDAKKL